MVSSSFTPLARSASTVAYRSVEPSATCWMPSPWYRSRYSWICPAFSAPSSLIGMRILPHGLVIAFDFTPVTWPSMSK